MEKTRDNTLLYFKGIFNASAYYDEGDIVIENGETKFFTGNEFIRLDFIEAKCEPSKKILPKTCTRCGAPVDSSHVRCAYCSCEY